MKALKTLLIAVVFTGLFAITAGIAIYGLAVGHLAWSRSDIFSAICTFILSGTAALMAASTPVLAYLAYSDLVALTHMKEQK